MTILKFPDFYSLLEFISNIQKLIIFNFYSSCSISLPPKDNWNHSRIILHLVQHEEIKKDLSKNLPKEHPFHCSFCEEDCLDILNLMVHSAEKHNILDNIITNYSKNEVIEMTEDGNPEAQSLTLKHVNKEVQELKKKVDKLDGDVKDEFIDVKHKMMDLERQLQTI